MADRVMSAQVEAHAVGGQTPPGRGSSQAPFDAGNSNRVLGLFRRCPKGVK